MIIFNSLSEPPLEMDVLLAVVAILIWIGGIHSSLRRNANEQFRAILKRLDELDASIDRTQREIRKLDEKTLEASSAKIVVPDEDEEILKDGWLATPVQHRRRDEGLKRRKASAEKALAIHGDLIAEAKRLCAKEGLTCDEFGCPEQYKTWIGDESPTAKTKFEAAKCVAEAYRPILLEGLRRAIGDELISKLGEPEKYLYPKSGLGHGEVLAYCNVEFNHVDQNLFEGPPLPEDTDTRVTINPYKKNIEVCRTASFGEFDPGFGEQYIPGDLRIIVGVQTVDDVAYFPYYLDWRYQINPTPKSFLKALVGMRDVPSVVD